MIYSELGQYEKSIQYFGQSLAVSHYKGEVMAHVGIIRKIVQAMLQLGQARQALTVLQDIMRQNPPLTHLNRVGVAVSFGLCYQSMVNPVVRTDNG
jgi:tetratricopeptide (TPR) repeat protein